MSRAKGSVRRLATFLSGAGYEGESREEPLYGVLLAEYVEWLRVVRGLTSGTVAGRRRMLVVFLDWMGPAGTAAGMGDLCRESVERFYLDWAGEKGLSTRRWMGQTLRTFLCFCHERGYTLTRLAGAVPKVHSYRLSRTPKWLEREAIEKVLAATPRETAAGRRDYAILQMLATYGVRGGQVARLCLEEVNWRKDEVLFRALKRGKDSRLPLTREVGDALLDYVQHSRPESSHREVFLTCSPPFRPLHLKSGVSNLVKRRLRAAGIETPGLAAHGFRHARATQSLAEGHSLKEIADVLGHRDLRSTFLYTKVDFETLRPVALEWPEEVTS